MDCVMEFPGEMGTASYVGAINGTDLDRLDAAHVWYPFTQMRTMTLIQPFELTGARAAGFGTIPGESTLMGTLRFGPRFMVTAIQTSTAR